ncbi:hypothetical protein RclHR1_07890008 [Rhizophagus clarus]|uniref:Uncharacterized protein n=1 Tax=Rhizophagus clarus TaxID=94130 RepID=A0A2Z6S0K4_9GLOM|nr:hypothetical protein RclHR1_07890008 [Rhizophagus clarus]GES97235.1 hypothetical protein GLOIN_2v1678875 [Rhizophagus clarus]
MENSTHQKDIKMTDSNPNPNPEGSYDKLMNDYKKLEKRLEEQINLNNEKDNEIRELKRKNIELIDEASKYQSALGTATNLQLSDSDTNNPVALKSDILKLQDFLEDYITTCKGNVGINIFGVQKLLKKYGSNTIVTIDEKPLIKAVLQRHVIQQIFTYGEEYFDFNNMKNHEKYGYGTETHLYNRTYELIRLAKAIAENRDGVDDITKVLPIKLRQEVFAALGNRGFNKIIDNKEAFPHEFISYYQTDLNEEIAKYRTLKDPEKKREVEDMAGEIIKKVVTLFWFRIKVQEPIVIYRWFKCNDNIQPSYMEGTWEDTEIDNIAVDICYFPLIAQKFDDKSKRQVYTPARIFHKSKQNMPERKNQLKNQNSENV